MATSEALLEDGTLSFSVETRVLRELGERLVKQPDVALVELIKNAYDADADECAVEYSMGTIVVRDNGTGMTLDRFTNAWMRIGTASKEGTPLSRRYGRAITGEKGIGRFAVRFLGKALHLETVADDDSRELRTRLTADFDWPRFDRNEDLGDVQVPYRLVEATPGARTGTQLVITKLRVQSLDLNLDRVRTGSIGMLTPLRSLFQQTTGNVRGTQGEEDPGFELKLKSGHSAKAMDVASRILATFVLRARMTVTDNELDLKVYRKGARQPELRITDTYVNQIGGAEADIRFFPRRKGAFAGLPVDGRYAQTWIRENHGVAVFDRMFRVPPYGTPDDDWLRLQADAASNRRDPRSSLAKRHLSMPEGVKSDTRLNWMLRLPQSMQLVGLVCVNGRRTAEAEGGEGLIASADREGFLANDAFKQLRDVVRGAVEAMAYVDRELQQKEEAKERTKQLAAAEAETREAIRDIERNPDIARDDRQRIVAALVRTQRLAEEQGGEYQEREQRLEMMSLLGVVAGFMTHEFGVALAGLESAHRSLERLAERQRSYRKPADQLAERIEHLKEYVGYTSLYIEGARDAPKKVYAAMPRIRRVKRIYGPYAAERDIAVELTGISPTLEAPLVPVALYDGLALNLFTNALKAVTAKVREDRARVAFRAWNDRRWHCLEVSDTGIGIPAALRDRVFDPLFTTTASRNDPLGSGLGLGLTLVRRCAEAFGGRAAVVRPRDGFATTVRVRLPLRERREE